MQRKLIPDLASMPRNTPVPTVIIGDGNINATEVTGGHGAPSWCVQRKHDKAVVWTVLKMWPG